MFAAKEYVSTRPILVFVPFALAINGDKVDTVWQSRLTFPGTRLRLDRRRLHCMIEDRWHDARLTAAIHLADDHLHSDKTVLAELLQGGAVVRAPLCSGDFEVASVDVVATSDLLPLIRIDPSYEFAMLMTASEDLRFAAEDAGLRVLGRDVGQDRCVALSISTPGGDEMLLIKCDTSFGEWDVSAGGGFESALAFATPDVDRNGSPLFGSVTIEIQPSELGHLCARLTEALPDVWQPENEIRYQQMAM